MSQKPGQGQAFGGTKRTRARRLPAERQGLAQGLAQRLGAVAAGALAVALAGALAVAPKVALKGTLGLELEGADFVLELRDHID